jgi:hypothetical protein
MAGHIRERDRNNKAGRGEERRDKGRGIRMKEDERRNGSASGLDLSERSADLKSAQ